MRVQYTKKVPKVSKKCGAVMGHVPFFYKQNSPSISVYNGDCTVLMKRMKRESVDLLITSPPYNVSLEYHSNDDGGSYDDYLLFTEEYLKQSYQIAKSSARFCLNIPLDKLKGGQHSVLADITTIAKKVGWRYHSTIVWNEGNISRRTAWGSWMSASAPYVIAPVEMIVVLYKEVWKKKEKGENDITRDEFIAWTNGVWSFNGQSKKGAGGHPAAFPVELPKRCIKLFSFVGDVVVDPFVGSGSTLIAAQEHNRSGIGFDVTKEYCEIARDRISQYAT